MANIETDKWGTIIHRHICGDIHRKDGPAIEFTNGEKYWFLFNRPYTEFQHSAEVAGMKPPVSHSQSKG